MNDERRRPDQEALDDLIRDLAQGHNEPPPTPRDAIWNRIEATRQAAARPRWRSPWIWLPAAALYWDAFARYRMGKRQHLHRAVELLEMQHLRYPQALTLVEADELAIRIKGKLAELGDAGAAYQVAREAEKLAQVEILHLAEAVERERSLTREEREALRKEHAEQEMRVMALNALMNMDSGRAMPILIKVLENHENEPELRTHALSILGMCEDRESHETLLKVIREDPDADVREMAVFWFSQYPSPDNLKVLKKLLAEEEHPGIREQALFAIAQSDDEEALVVLRDLARDSKADPEAREQAIFWIGQRGDDESLDILKGLYSDLDGIEAKERVLFSVAQADEGDVDWLLGVVRDKREPVELRGRALFWAGQVDDVPVKVILDFYRDAEDPDIKKQALFTLANAGGDEAVEQLMKIAREEKDPELRTMAVFWVGQSDHPKAAEFLEEIINK